VVVTYYSDEMDDESEDLYYYGNILSIAQGYAHCQYRMIEMDKIKREYRQLDRYIDEYKNRILNTAYDYENRDEYLTEFLRDKQIEIETSIIKTLEKRISEIEHKYNEIFNSHCYQFNMDDDEIREYREKLAIW